MSADQLKAKRDPAASSERKDGGKRDIVLCSSVLAVIGAVDLAIASASGFNITFLGVLGVISLIAAFGVGFRKSWGLWVGVVSGVMTITAGAATMYGSAMYLGAPTDLNTLVLYLGLLIYTLAALATILYLTSRRSVFKPPSEGIRPK